MELQELEKKTHMPVITNNFVNEVNAVDQDMPKIREKDYKPATSDLRQPGGMSPDELTTLAGVHEHEATSEEPDTVTSLAKRIKMLEQHTAAWQTLANKLISRL